MDLVVTARIYQDSANLDPQEIMDARVSVDLPPGLEEDTNRSATFAITPHPGISLTLKSLADLSWKDGVFHIGEALDGTEFQMTLPAQVTASASSGEPLCVTATITAQPPTGPSPNLDDTSDNVSKVCLGTAPAGEMDVLDSGTVDLFTWYDCVGKTASPCDQKDDGDATTNDDLQLVVFAGNAAEKFGVFQPSQVVVHVPEPAGRTVNKTGGLVWSTGFENWNVCTAVDSNCLPGNRDRPGAVIAVNASLLNYKPTTETNNPTANWGVDHPEYSNWHTGQIKVTAVVPTDDQGNPRGKIKGWRDTDPIDELFWGNDVDPNDATAPTLLMDYNMYLGDSTQAVGGWRDERYIEFSALGTYLLTVTTTVAYDDDGDDQTDTVSHSDAETYTFHVGPLADLSVAGGASPHVAPDRNALTIAAANNGPDITGDAQVKIKLPSGAQVEDYVASEGTYAKGVWKLPGLKSRDYRRSSGKPEAATLTFILKEGSGAPQEPAEATISLTNDAYTVCIASNRNTLAHNSRAACKADSDTTDVWYAAVCVQDSDQTVNTTTTHDTEAECAAQTGHTWTAKVCANEDGKVIAGRNEAECDGWHTGTVYDPSGNNTAEITAAKGTGGSGPGIPASVTALWSGGGVMWDDVELLYGVPISHYQVQRQDGSRRTILDREPKESMYVDSTASGRPTTGCGR